MHLARTKIHMTNVTTTFNNVFNLQWKFFDHFELIITENKDFQGLIELLNISNIRSDTVLSQILTEPNEHYSSKHDFFKLFNKNSMLSSPPNMMDA